MKSPKCQELLNLIPVCVFLKSFLCQQFYHTNQIRSIMIRMWLLVLTIMAVSQSSRSRELRKRGGLFGKSVIQLSKVSKQADFQFSLHILRFLAWFSFHRTSTVNNQNINCVSVLKTFYYTKKETIGKTNVRVLPHHNTFLYA